MHKVHMLTYLYFVHFAIYQAARPKSGRAKKTKAKDYHLTNCYIAYSPVLKSVIYDTNLFREIIIRSQTGTRSIINQCIIYCELLQ